MPLGASTSFLHPALASMIVCDCDNCKVYTHVDIHGNEKPGRLLVASTVRAHQAKQALRKTRETALPSPTQPSGPPYDAAQDNEDGTIIFLATLQPAPTGPAQQLPVRNIDLVGQTSPPAYPPVSNESPSRRPYDIDISFRILAVLQ